MPIFRLIGFKWGPSKKLVQAMDEHEKLIKFLPLISRKLSVPSMKNYTLYACNEADEPVRPIDVEKSLKDNGVPAMGAIYVAEADKVPPTVVEGGCAPVAAAAAAAAASSAEETNDETRASAGGVDESAVVAAVDDANIRQDEEEVAAAAAQKMRQEQESAAATKIQAVQRGRVVRAEVATAKKQADEATAVAAAAAVASSASTVAVRSVGRAEEQMSSTERNRQDLAEFRRQAASLSYHDSNSSTAVSAPPVAQSRATEQQEEAQRRNAAAEIEEQAKQQLILAQQQQQQRQEQREQELAQLAAQEEALRRQQELDTAAAAAQKMRQEQESAAATKIQAAQRGRVVRTEVAAARKKAEEEAAAAAAAKKKAEEEAAAAAAKKKAEEEAAAAAASARKKEAEHANATAHAIAALGKPVTFGSMEHSVNFDLASTSAAAGARSSSSGSAVAAAAASGAAHNHQQQQSPFASHSRLVTEVSLRSLSSQSATPDAGGVVSASSAPGSGFRRVQSLLSTLATPGRAASLLVKTTTLERELREEQARSETLGNAAEANRTAATLQSFLTLECENRFRKVVVAERDARVALLLAALASLQLIHRMDIAAAIDSAHSDAQHLIHSAVRASSPTKASPSALEVQRAEAQRREAMMADFFNSMLAAQHQAVIVAAVSSGTPKQKSRAAALINAGATPQQILEQLAHRVGGDDSHGGEGYDHNNSNQHQPDDGMMLDAMDFMRSAQDRQRELTTKLEAENQRLRHELAEARSQLMTERTARAMLAANNSNAADFSAEETVAAMQQQMLMANIESQQQQSRTHRAALLNHSNGGVQYMSLEEQLVGVQSPGSHHGSPFTQNRVSPTQQNQTIHNQRERTLTPSQQMLLNVPASHSDVQAIREQLDNLRAVAGKQEGQLSTVRAQLAEITKMYNAALEARDDAVHEREQMRVRVHEMEAAASLEVERVKRTCGAEILQLQRALTVVDRQRTNRAMQEGNDLAVAFAQQQQLQGTAARGTKMSFAEYQQIWHATQFNNTSTTTTTTPSKKSPAAPRTTPMAANSSSLSSPFSATPIRRANNNNNSSTPIVAGASSIRHNVGGVQMLPQQQQQQQHHQMSILSVRPSSSSTGTPRGFSVAQISRTQSSEQQFASEQHHPQPQHHGYDYRENQQELRDLYERFVTSPVAGRK